MRIRHYRTISRNVISDNGPHVQRQVYPLIPLQFKTDSDARHDISCIRAVSVNNITALNEYKKFSF